MGFVMDWLRGHHLGMHLDCHSGLHWAVHLDCHWVVRSEKH